MWFRRKRKNRRLSRGHVLDVKLRSDRVRAARIRLGAMAFGLLFGTVFGLYLLWRIGDWALDRLVYENRAFAIRQIDVQTDGEISVDQLRRWAGVKLGQNLLALNLADVKRNLEMAPMIGSASIERVLPSTLRIRVAEREPIAQVIVLRQRAGGGIGEVVFQLDGQGYAMIPLKPRQRARTADQLDNELPVLTGIATSDVPQPGRRVESPQMLAALQLISAFECSPMAGLVSLRRIDVGSEDVLVAVTGQGSAVTFGLKDLDWQLRRWGKIFESGRSMNKVIATLDLAVTNNTPINWMEASVVPASNPARPRTQHYRKRHV